jgi:phage baseplate assembly protein W
MQGFSVKLPITYDKTTDGPYALNKSLAETIKQNLKMLLLTNPGERIMNSDFGVGLTRVLFESDTQEIRDILEQRIMSQIRKYLNYITVEEINISPVDSNEENTLFINIRYSIPSLNINDELNINT